MQCPVCGTEYPDGRFCPSCGVDTELTRCHELIALYRKEFPSYVSTMNAWMVQQDPAGVVLKMQDWPSGLAKSPIMREQMERQAVAEAISRRTIGEHAMAYTWVRVEGSEHYEMYGERNQLVADVWREDNQEPIWCWQVYRHVGAPIEGRVNSKARACHDVEDFLDAHKSGPTSQTEAAKSDPPVAQEDKSHEQWTPGAIFSEKPEFVPLVLSPGRARALVADSHDIVEALERLGVLRLTE